MKFIIEPINDTDCRIVDIDCSDIQEGIEEITFPATIEQEGKVWYVKEVGTPALYEAKPDSCGFPELTAPHPRACFATKTDSARYAALRNLKKIIFSEGIETINVVMGNDGKTSAQRGNADSLQEISFPSTITTIGNQAFCNCNALEYINLPNSLRVIGEEAFRNCKKISSVTMPDSLEEIGAKAFESCQELTSVFNTNSVKKIGHLAFYDCPKLSSINMPDRIEEIGMGAFGENPIYRRFALPKSLRKLTLPISTLDDEFDIRLVIPEGIEEIIVKDIFYSTTEYNECIVPLKAWEIFDQSPLTGRIRNLVIPEGVKKVNGRYCNLSSVSFPSTIEEIGQDAFANSSVLDKLSELPASLRVIGANAFLRACDYLGYSQEYTFDVLPLRILSKKIEIGADAFLQYFGHFKLIADEAVISSMMGTPGALNGTTIEAIDIMEGTTVVDVNRCVNLKKLTIPATVTEIRKISDCPELERLDIPSSVTQIGEISNLYSLRELRLPNGLKRPKRDDGKMQFRELKIKIEASLEVWNELCATEECFKNVVIIGGALIIPEGVETISYRFFTDSKIKTLFIPSTVTKIGAYAFHECSSLETVNFAEGSRLESVAWGAFCGTALKNIVFPKGMKAIASNVFENTPSLESITFPETMTEFWEDYYDEFFTDCKSLKYLVFLADNPDSAVYPKTSAKKVDWYVPDHMVGHVTQLLSKNMVKARSVKPLSKLKKRSTSISKKIVKSQEITKPATYESFTHVEIDFPISEEDMPMLADQTTYAILAIRYMREKIKDCSFYFTHDKPIFSALDLDTLTLPEFITKYDCLSAWFTSLYPNYRKELPKTPAYLHISVTLRVKFEFPIGKGDNPEQCVVKLPGWGDLVCLYKGRYIPYSSFSNSGYCVSVYKNEEDQLVPREIPVYGDGISSNIDSVLSFIGDIISPLK